MAKKSLNQVELARISGVKQQYISRYLNENSQGKYPRDIKTLLSLCQALDCNLYDLTGIPELRRVGLIGAQVGDFSKEALKFARKYDALPPSDPRRVAIKKSLSESDKP